MAPDGYPRFSIQWFKSSGPLEHNLRVPQLLKTYVVTCTELLVKRHLILGGVGDYT